MIYDRQRRGPALVGISLAVNLTKEEANRIERTLMAEWEGKRSGCEQLAIRRSVMMAID